MTFQTALIGSDGLVIGSDRNAVTFTPEQDGNPTAQRFEVFKFIKDPKETIFCVNAGGIFGAQIARKIASEAVTNVSDEAWEQGLFEMAYSVIRPSEPWPVDEILVARADRPDAVWFVTKYPGSSASVVKITSKICIGDRSHARFLTEVLWNKRLTTAQLEALAHLTLSYASFLNPSGVGLGFDFLTVTQNGITWKNTLEIDLYKSFNERISEVLFSLPTA